MKQKCKQRSRGIAWGVFFVLALFIFQCGGGSEMFDYICPNGTRADGKTTVRNTEKCTACNDDTTFTLTNERCLLNYICTNGTAAEGEAPMRGVEKCAGCDSGFALRNERCVTTPVAVLYQAVLGTTTGFDASLGGQSFNLCSESNAPDLLKASQGYTGHTFYGARNGTNGNFNQLPERLGGDNPGAREMRLWRAGATSLHTPTTTTTLSELIHLSTDGHYKNIVKVQPIFRWMQHGDETMGNHRYRYWSFIGSDSGHYNNSANCQHATRADAIGGSTNIGEHGGESHRYNSTILSCGGHSLNVLCLARKDSFFGAVSEAGLCYLIHASHVVFPANRRA